MEPGFAGLLERGLVFVRRDAAVERGARIRARPRLVGGMVLCHHVDVGVAGNFVREKTCFFANRTQFTPESPAK